MTACAVRQSMREAIRRGRWLRRICLHGSILSLDLRDLYPHWLSRASHVLRRPSWPCTERAVSRYVRKVKIRTAPKNGITQVARSLRVMTFLIERPRTAKPSESAMLPTDGFAPLLSECDIAIQKPIDSRTNPPKTRAGIHLLS